MLCCAATGCSAADLPSLGESAFWDIDACDGLPFGQDCTAKCNTSLTQSSTLLTVAPRITCTKRGWVNQRGGDNCAGEILAGTRCKECCPPLRALRRGGEGGEGALWGIVGLSLRPSNKSKQFKPDKLGCASTSHVANIGCWQ